MVQTYSDSNKIYSVDMMFAYINIYKPKSNYVDIKPLLNIRDGEILKKYLLFTIRCN